MDVEVISVSKDLFSNECYDSETVLPTIYDSHEGISEEMNEEIRNINKLHPLANITNIVRNPNKNKAGPGRYSKAEKSLEISKENMALYCYCNSVEHGKMVGCDNENCEVGWFHFGCVGIKYKPRGNWLCKNCK